MNETALKIYHGLPSPLKSFTATARGLYLRHWRYGPETERLVAEAVERERWSPAQWQRWREVRLAQILHRAATRVPFYRDTWTSRRRNGDRRSYEYLEHWPILGKEELRANPLRFVADDCDVRNMFHEHTSGSTGKPVDLWWSRQTVKEWYALFEARWRNWYGVSRRDRWAILGGQLVIPVERQHPPFWVKNRALRQLYMSSYHLQPGFVPAYIDALRRFRVKYLWGYTSSLLQLAQGVLDAGGKHLDLSVVITNAEPLLDHQRQHMNEAFGCPVRETYGMAEIVTAAGECQAGRLHLWPEVGIVEFFDQEKPVVDSLDGEMICTGLVNSDMPLIRYRVGDRSALVSSHEQCACGRTLPMLKLIEGRSDDMLYTAAGRRIGRLDTVFKNRIPIREAQIVQEELTRVLVRYVPAEGFSESTKDTLTERIQARMGVIEVAFQELQHIPRLANGKMRGVICQLPREQLDKVRGGAGAAEQGVS